MYLLFVYRLEEAAQALPLNLLLTLFYIEFEEKRKAFEKCKTLFETFVKAAQTEIDRVKTNAPSSSSSSASSASSSSTDTAETSSSEATETNKKDEEEDAFLNKLLSLCYIRYMMFVCRTEGIKNARTIFRTAREDTRSTYHVYVAAALMEYHHGNTVVAIKIFRLAIQSGGFKNNQELILSYLDFQSSLNEDDATRAAFSEMTSQLDKSKAKEVWSRYLSFESDHGR